MLSDLGQREALIWPFFVPLPGAHAINTGNILRATRSLHEALGRELSSVSIEREASFAGATRTLT